MRTICTAIMVNCAYLLLKMFCNTMYIFVVALFFSNVLYFPSIQLKGFFLKNKHFMFFIE